MTSSSFIQSHNLYMLHISISVMPTLSNTTKVPHITPTHFQATSSQNKCMGDPPKPSETFTVLSIDMKKDIAKDALYLHVIASPKPSVIFFKSCISYMLPKSQGSQSYLNVYCIFIECSQSYYHNWWYIRRVQVSFYYHSILTHHIICWHSFCLLLCYD